MGHIVLFGELMIRLSTKGFERIVQANEFDIRFTGAEANVGVSCVNYGLSASVLSKIPDTDLGLACLNFLNRFGLNTEYVVRGGERLGILYTETGCSQRASKVIYDRLGSAFSELDSGEIDWQQVLRGKEWLHFCGTAPAHGVRVQKVLLEGLKTAKQLGLTVSADYNYRSKLWSREEARRAMEPLMEYVDIGIGNEEDCEAMFGVRASGANLDAGKIEYSSYGEVARKMVQKFHLHYQAITLRESISASRNGWSAIIDDGTSRYLSNRYEIDVVDRIGAGDSFSGGLIAYLMKGKKIQESLEFAVAASCLKHTILGDFNLVSEQDVLTLLAGNGSGRIQR